MTQVADSWNPDIHSSIATELLSCVSGMYVFMCAHVCACAFVCVMVARSQSQVVPWISLNLIFWGTESLTLELTDCLGQLANELQEYTCLHSSPHPQHLHCRCVLPCLPFDTVMGIQTQVLMPVGETLHRLNQKPLQTHTG